MALKNMPKPVGGGALGYFDTTYDGKTYRVAYSTDIANNNFLKVKKIVEISTNTEIRTDNPLYIDKIKKGVQFDEDFQASVSKLKQVVGETKPNVLPKMEEAAKLAGTEKYYNSVKTATGTQGTAPAYDPSLADNLPGEILPDSGPVAIPQEIKDLQETAEATIQSLIAPGEELINIIYPEDANYQNTQDHILFEQFSYRAPQERLLTTGQGQITTNFAQIVTRGLERNANVKKFIGTVKLPIPNQLAISNGVSWGEDRANPVEAAAFFGALGLAQQALNGNVGGVINQAFTGASQFLDIMTKDKGLSSGTPSGLLLSSFISQYLLGKIGINVDPGQFIARGTGTTINPNLELLFNGPKLRSFSFTFEFAPNGPDDALAARRVMRFFRQGMAPKRLATNTIFIGSPNIFRISYRGNGGQIIDGLNRFKICALTSCELNFTPEGVYQSYDDPNVTSMPVRTNMTLSFTELTPIFAQDYEKQDLDPNKLDPSLVDAFSPSDAVEEFTQLKYDDIGF